VSVAFTGTSFDHSFSGSHMTDAQTDTPTTAPDRERAAATAMSLDAFAESRARAQAAEQNELSAALAPLTGPLPLTVSTLRYLPVDAQSQYERSPDGSFRLAWLRSNDVASQAAHASLVSEGRFKFLAEGETPASRRAAAERATAMNQRALAVLAGLEKTESDAKLARADARFAKERAAFEQERAEHVRQQEIRARVANP